jgi:hypothetical protein
VLVAVDVVHVAGIAAHAAGSAGTKLTQAVSGSYLSAMGWIAGGAAVWLLGRRRRPDGVFAAGFAGAFIALNGGVADLSDLSRSQIAFAWPEGVARAAVALSLGIGVGLVAAAFIAVRRHGALASLSRPVTPIAPSSLET